MDRPGTYERNLPEIEILKQLSLFDFLPTEAEVVEFKIVEPKVETFKDIEPFVKAVVRVARTNPREFKYQGVDAAGLVEAIFKIESPNTKVKRI